MSPASCPREVNKKKEERIRFQLRHKYNKYENRKNYGCHNNYFRNLLSACLPNTAQLCVMPHSRHLLQMPAILFPDNK